MVVDFQFFLSRGDCFAEALGVFGVAGGGTEVGDAGAPEFVERAHRKFAKIFCRHRCQGGRQEPLALHAEADVSSRFRRAPFVAAFGVAFVDGFDPVFGKMMLQESGVEVAAAVFVADDVSWGLGAGGWGLGSCA